jgi:ATPase subunit of ABC transporter with duplicated ATPase domains
MGGLKKAFKKIIGALDPQRAAQKKAEEAARQQAAEAEAAAQRQAELEAANQAATATAGAGTKESTTDVEGDTVSKQKKKLSGGRKGLTVARSGGKGINI